MRRENPILAAESGDPDEAESRARAMAAARERLTPLMSLVEEELPMASHVALAMRVEVSKGVFVWTVMSTNRVIAAEGLKLWADRVLKEADSSTGDAG